MIMSSFAGLSKVNFSPEERELISRVYMKGIHGVFLSFAVLAAVLFIMTIFVEDYGLKGREETLEEIE